MRLGRIACVVAIASFGLVVGTAVAATFSDPAGDTLVAPEGADTSGLVNPDITGIEVTNTPAGVVMFEVTLATQTLVPLSAVVVLLDLDKNPQTGDGGDEALLGYGHIDPLGTPETHFERWDGSAFVEVDATAAGVTGAFSGGVVTITAPRSELLDTRGFDFTVGAFAANADASAFVIDFAPDFLLDPFVYELEGLPPPPPPTLAAVGMAGSPLPPKAGKRFVVSTVVTRSDTESIVTAGRVTCTARAGTTKIRAAGRLASLRAQCSMTIPRAAKGKVLRGTMTVRAAGATLKRPFSFPIG